MRYLLSINKFKLKHALGVALGVFAAFIINYYYSFSHEYWMVLAAFLVSQTTKGTPIKQGMIIFLIMMAALVFSSLLLLNIKNAEIIYILLSILFIASAYLSFINRPQSNKFYFLSILFFIVALISAFTPVLSSEFMQNRLMDIVIGAFIGIVCVSIIAPVKLEHEFSEGIIPILNCLNQYTTSLTEALLAPQEYKKSVSSIRAKVESALQENVGVYPTWVYEVGFNRGLRSGLRFFLINIERVSEIYFSMDNLISCGMDAIILQGLYANIDNAMQRNQELLSILTGYFQNKKIEYTPSDFTSDMAELEKTVRQTVPDNIEALDISPNYLLITAFIRATGSMPE